MATHSIYDGPAYQLTARTTSNKHTGRTLAQHPRQQRIVSLTLPDEAFAKLAAVCLEK